MTGKSKKVESDQERFSKNLAALLVVPKDEIEALEAARKRRSRKIKPNKPV